MGNSNRTVNTQKLGSVKNQWKKWSNGLTASQICGRRLKLSPEIEISQLSVKSIHRERQNLWKFVRFSENLGKKNRRHCLFWLENRVCENKIWGIVFVKLNGNRNSCDPRPVRIAPAWDSLSSSRVFVYGPAQHYQSTFWWSSGPLTLQSLVQGIVPKLRGT